MSMARREENRIPSKPSWVSKRDETISINNMDFPSLSEVTGKNRKSENKVSSRQTYSDKLKEKTDNYTQLGCKPKNHSNNQKISYQSSEIISNENDMHVPHSSSFESSGLQEKYHENEQTYTKTEPQNVKLTNKSYASKKLHSSIEKAENISHKNSIEFQNYSPSYKNLQHSEAKLSAAKHSSIKEPIYNITKQKVKRDANCSRIDPSQVSRRNIQNDSNYPTSTMVKSGSDLAYNQIGKTSDEGYTQVSHRKPKGKSVHYYNESEPHSSENKYELKNNVEHNRKSSQSNAETVKSSISNNNYASYNKCTKESYENVNKSRYINEGAKSKNLSANRMYNSNAGNNMESGNKVRTQYKPISTNVLSSQNSAKKFDDNEMKGSNSKQLEVGPSEPKKKRKRKSKVKRQAAIQTGKISILTPEAHSKIMNQSKSEKAHTTMEGSITNIDDKEEYPELGMSLVKKDMKRSSGRNTDVQLDSFESCGRKKDTNTTTEELVSSGNKVVEGKQELDAEKHVHTKDPITLSIFDMVSASKSKKKETEERVVEKENSSVLYPNMKVLRKKVLSRPVNPLDSSRLTVKRGKESERPKIKKPSRMKKIILTGRQLKAERILALDLANKKESSGQSTDTASEEGLSPRSNNWNEIASLNGVPVVSEDTEHESVPLSDTALENARFDSSHSKSLPSLLQINSETFYETYSESNFPKKCDELSPTSIDKRDNLAEISRQILFDQASNGISSQSGLQMEQKCSLSFQFTFNDSFSEVKVLLNLDENSLSHLSLNNKLNEYSDFLAKNIISEAIVEVKSMFNEQLVNQEVVFASVLTKSLSDCQSSNKNLNVKNCTDNQDTLLGKGQELTNDSDDTSNNSKRKFSRQNELSKNEILKSDLTLPEPIEGGEGSNIKSAKIISASTISEIAGSIGNLSTPLEAADTESENRIFSDKERLEVAKVLLHSNKFRDYCNHFVNKKLDDAVDALIDDLARFQDRTHQKEPLKAKMKRRLIYGIKEIKKHLKIKKLKCVIIATDIENIQTEGGLNELLMEMISLTESYHIPYVFSHRRFKLGKICRKPSPVSCVGIFNYEGSEKNYKNILELHAKSKLDYEEITKIIAAELTNDQINAVQKTIEEVPYTPYELYRSIIKEIFTLYLNLNTVTLPPMNVLNPCNNENEEFKQIQDTLERYNIILQ